MLDPNKMCLFFSFVLFSFSASPINGQLCSDFTISSCSNDEYIIDSYPVSFNNVDILKTLIFSTV